MRPFAATDLLKNGLRKNTGTARRARAFCAAVLSMATTASATDPVTAAKTAIAANESISGMARAGRGLIEVPRQLAQCFRLPLGLAELLFSPLPDVDFKQGLKDTGKGVIAPFKLCIATLEMPYEVYSGLDAAATGVVK